MESEDQTGPSIQPSDQGGPSIQPSDNGPYLLRGSVAIVDPKGNVFQVESKNVALCRCGHSENKPFCDGTHNKIGFKSVVRAPGVAEETNA